MGCVNSAKKRLLLPHPIIETNYGKIEGKRIQIDIPNETKFSNIFLGIPFAKPPIGDLRFQKPQLPNLWDSILSCKKYKPISIQKQLPFKHFKESEDCLYLNIFVPTWQTQNKNGFPVMFYIHGGGFIMDSPNNYHYQNLSRTLVKNGVIVVTICYRLGLLGYFCTSDDTAIGNYGLWDQYFALKFIHENITAFGGDPGNITVFGQSAGGVSSDLLSILPISRDMVSKVACLGGNGETNWAVSARKIAAKNCQELVIKLGYKRKYGNGEWNTDENQELMKWMKSLPIHKFELTMIGSNAMFQKLRLDLGPVIDGDILPSPPSILRQEASSRPILAGNTDHESLFIFPLMMKSLNNNTVVQIETIHKKFGAKYAKAFDSNENFVFEDLKKAYGITALSMKDKKFRNKTVVLMMDDFVNNFALYNFAELERKKGSNVWIYYFEQHNPGITKILHHFMPFEAATHATELAYLLDTNIYMMPYRKTSDDKIVQEMFSKMYTNFAKFGNPNGDPRYPANNVMKINWEPVTDEYPEKHLRISANPIQKDQFDTRIKEKYSEFYANLTKMFYDSEIYQLTENQ